jgi:hypothetical protein
MNDMSIEAGGADAARPQGLGMESLSAGDYCHLAEECFVLAALAKDPEAAAKLVKTGDDYLRCAAERRSFRGVAAATNPESRGPRL